MLSQSVLSFFGYFGIRQADRQTAKYQLSRNLIGGGNNAAETNKHLCYLIDQINIQKVSDLILHSDWKVFLYYFFLIFFYLLLLPFAFKPPQFLIASLQTLSVGSLPPLILLYLSGHQHWLILGCWVRFWKWLNQRAVRMCRQHWSMAEVPGKFGAAFLQTEL